MQYITKTGFDKLKKELEERKSAIRQEIARSIKEAKEQGDLSENAEYAEARRQQRDNESRIMQLENIIRTSKVVADKNHKDQIDIGSEIEVEFKGSKMSFYMVGSNEANPAQGKISNESPIGKAFMGKKRGENIVVVLPNGKKAEYKIVSFK